MFAFLVGRVAANDRGISMEVSSTRHTAHFWDLGVQQRAASWDSCKGYWIFQGMAEERYHNGVTVSLVTTRKYGNLVNHLYSRITKTTFSLANSLKSLIAPLQLFTRINTFVSNVKKTICLWVCFSVFFQRPSTGRN